MDIGFGDLTQLEKEKQYLSADSDCGQGKYFESLQRVLTYSTSLRLQCVRPSASFIFSLQRLRPGSVMDFQND